MKLLKRFRLRNLACLFFTIFLFVLPGATGIAQKVKVINVEGPKKYSCGGFYWRVKFELDKAAPSNGIIVQQITETRDIKDCLGNQTATNPKTFWEAWTVDSGKTTCEPSGGGYSDQFSEPSHPNTYGTIKIEGTLAFFPVAVPASFVPPKHPHSGSLPSDTTQPAFWPPAAGNSTSHNLTVTWDCCNGNDTARLTTVPAFTVINVNTMYNACITTTPTAQLITSIPAWTKGYDASKQAAFNNVMNSLRLYTDNEILNGIRCIVSNRQISGDAYLDEMSKIYIALRALYQVPEQLPGAAARAYGGWKRPGNESPAGTGVLWPLQRIGAGQLVVTGTYNGYIGHNYDAIGEFNDFRSHYPRNTGILIYDADVNQTKRVK